jgi:predicted phage terminase large subunit-like protein
VFDVRKAAEHPEAELAARELCRRHLLPFIQRFRPDYLAGWVHADICRRLERFMHDIEARRSPRLLLMAPYRHGKSDIASRHFAPWILGHHPEWEIIAASNAQSLATSFSRYIRDLIRHEGYATLFPETALDPHSQSVEGWNTTRSGSYLASGVGTAIVGFGANCLLLDDPVREAEAADSPVIRDNVWEWYLSTAYSRLAPGGGVIGIMTRWNEDDWGGRIQLAAEMGGDKFEIVKYPAINEQGDEYILADDTIVQIPRTEPPQPVPAGARLTRPLSSALHPARYSLEALLKIKANYYALGQKRWWSAGYQQEPSPDEGNYFTKEMFRYAPATPDRTDLYIYQAWDFAISETKTADYNVGVTLGVDHRDNVYVLDMTRFKLSDGNRLVETVVEYAQHWEPIVLGVEDGQIWKALEAQFRKVCDEKRYWPSIEVLRPLTDKMARASPLRGRMEAGKVWFDPQAVWFSVLEREFLIFPSGKHDDCIDAAAWAVRLTLTRAAPRQRQRPVPRSWRDGLEALVSGGGSWLSA